MKSRINYYVLAMVAISMLLFLALSCTGTDKKPPKEEPSSSEGRIIVPDSKPSEETPNPGAEQTKSVSGGESPVSTGSEEPAVNRDIKISLFIGDKEHPMNQPIMVHEGEQVSCEFRITSTSSDLIDYTIENPSRVGLKQQGKLSGKEGKIPYTFTFLSRNWGPGGIKITVSNEGGSVEFRQVMVMQVDEQHPNGA